MRYTAVIFKKSRYNLGCKSGRKQECNTIGSREAWPVQKTYRYFVLYLGGANSSAIGHQRRICTTEYRRPAKSRAIVFRNHLFIYHFETCTRKRIPTTEGRSPGCSFVVHSVEWIQASRSNSVSSRFESYRTRNCTRSRIAMLFWDPLCLHCAALSQDWCREERERKKTIAIGNHLRP